MTFEGLGLSPEFLQILDQIGFKEPTEIQKKTIPLALAGKDIIGASATGSGKTLAFGASIIEFSQKKEGLQALVLVPTRELAEQVGKELQRFGKHKRIEVAIVYGGVGIEPQIYAIKRADIVVGTPGRILDHIERRTLNLSTIKTLVLDEADRMLDMGFIDDVTEIVELCPKERQTFLFSATMSADITYIAKHYMTEPALVESIVYVDASKLKQVYYDVPKHIKFSLLVHLMKQEHSGLVMVFCNTRSNADFVARNLNNNGIDAVAIHGGLTQARRNHIMEAFRSNKVCVIVCTDVAARGLDIKNVSHVYNYDLPPTSKEYVHRVGRTARAGNEGMAISIVAERDYDNFRQVLRDHSLKIEQVDVPQVEPAHVKLSDRRGSFGGRDRRGGRGSSYGSGRSSRGRDSGRGRDSDRGRSQGRSRSRY